MRSWRPGRRELRKAREEDGGDLAEGKGSSGRTNAEAELNMPPGFRFHLTNDELVVHYLCREVAALYKFCTSSTPGVCLAMMLGCYHCPGPLEGGSRSFGRKGDRTERNRSGAPLS
ncbi:uncharacterized protein LOC119270759 [Triticum dicoccoides]|uniref:uncharacterized protein LOC119270759 n=1 Tax=Triticum dicoccoides TaxID=85692 RepID=UPI00188FC186|nr:uncharacterized protein LOC119270759 [Triticum dicoccoides]